MATKRTKTEAPVAKPATPAPKRKLAVGPPPAEARATKPAAVTPLKTTRRPISAPLVAASSNGTSATLTIDSELIALRAYFIGERRRETGREGDETTDWLEAEQQLKSEAAV